MQKGLTARGLYEDTIDGNAGMKTRAALGAYQKANGLKLDCWPTSAVLDHMRAHRPQQRCDEVESSPDGAQRNLANAAPSRRRSRMTLRSIRATGTTGCSPLALRGARLSDPIELRLLLIAEVAVEVVERAAHSLHGPAHDFEPF